MSENEDMPRNDSKQPDFATMSHAERLGILLKELPFPSSVETANKVRAAVLQELADVDAMRERAAQRHGVALERAEPSAARPKKEKTQSDIRTVADVIECYRKDENSPLLRLRYGVRANYERRLDRIVKNCGHEKLADVKKADIERWYDGWSKGGMKKAMGHAHMTILRIVIGHGAKVLEDRECMRLFVILRGMTYKKSANNQGDQVDDKLTNEQIVAVIAKALRTGRESIALALALQFDCGLPQKDVIGEWVPGSEPGVSDIMLPDGQKWLRGIRWSEIDDNRVLRHTLSQTGKPVELDLNKYPVVKAQLDRLSARPMGGPLIIDEDTGKPFQAHKFRRLWRTMATYIGIATSVTSTGSGRRRSRLRSSRTAQEKAQ